MKQYFKYIALTFCIPVFFTGCSDFLEVESPKDQIDRNKVFSNDKLATAAVASIYSLLRDNGFLGGTSDGAGYLLGCYTDELEVTDSRTVPNKNFYLGTVTSSNIAVSKLWKDSYVQIYSANDALEGLELATELNVENQKQLKGEVLAIRGIIHFYLSQTFGDVPYVKTTDYNINKKISKKSVQEVMQLAIDDLIQAEQLLNDGYPSLDRVRINKSVVQGFLARMYLYLQKWDFAKEYAERVINNSNYQLESLDKVFLKESKSAIWQFKPDTEGENSLESRTYFFESLPAPYSRLSVELLNSFEPNDLKKELWIKEVGDTNENYFAYKYKVKGNMAASTEYSVVLRIEEMLLILAESAAHLADWELCNNMLNKLRERSGLPEITVYDKTLAINTILKERRMEFFCEFGHRFYDLKRTNKLNELFSVKENWKPHFELLPIPENELMLNSNLLPQNLGY